MCFINTVHPSFSLCRLKALDKRQVSTGRVSSVLPGFRNAVTVNNDVTLDLYAPQQSSAMILLVTFCNHGIHPSFSWVMWLGRFPLLFDSFRSSDSCLLSAHNLIRQLEYAHVVLFWKLSSFSMFSLRLPVWLGPLGYRVTYRISDGK